MVSLVPMKENKIYKQCLEALEIYNRKLLLVA